MAKPHPEQENAAAASDPVHIRVRDLARSFEGQRVLDGVNLDCLRGQINVVIGASGVGKSVLLKHMMGLLRPDRGQVVIDGQDIFTLGSYQLNRFRVKLGMVFQYAALFDSMTIEENVMFPLIEHRRGTMRREEMRHLAREKLHALGLHEVEHKYPAELSGGMRKRVGLARATILSPEALFYDEPTTGLDPMATKNVDEMIQETARTLGITSVVISHDMASTFRIGHRVSMLYNGRMIVSGPPEEILRQPPQPLLEFVETARL